MKVVFITVLSFLLFIMHSVAQTIMPAFPGADGYGKNATGGRGGTVIHVTRLTDDNTIGSLRYAIHQNYARIVVFDVGGVITLNSDLLIDNPNITIAGQTAPGEGICLKGATLRIRTSNVIVRGLRIRVGDEGNYNLDNRDGISIEKLSEYSTQQPENIIIDHCSVSWAVDENVQLWYGCKNVTIQHCIISEGLFRSKHPKVLQNPIAGHSCGMIIGNGSKQISVHHNLFAHNNGRNPNISYDTETEFVNNVIYNWGSWEGTIISNFNNIPNLISKVEIKGNLYIPGPDHKGVKPITLSSNIQPGSLIYLKDNLGPGRSTLSSGDDWLLANAIGFKSTAPVLPSSGLVPHPTDETGMNLLETILADAGAKTPVVDEIDSRVITTTKNRTGHLIHSASEAEGWEIYSNSARDVSFDTDQDGMPDSWEVLNGCNPSLMDDKVILSGEEYSNVERYLNGLYESACSIKATLPSYSISCYAQETASASVVVEGGSGNYLYEWNTNPVQTTSNATGLTAGMYRVKVTDVITGCITTATSEISYNDLTITDPVSGPSKVNAQEQAEYSVPLREGSTYTWEVWGAELLSGASEHKATIKFQTTNAYIRVTESNGGCIGKPVELGVTMSDCKLYTTNTGNYIKNVELSGKSNSSGAPTNPSIGYTDYTGFNVEVRSGSTYPIIVSPFSGGVIGYWKIWMDYNQNLQFEESEVVFLQSGLGNLSFNLPIREGIEGMIRLRIAMTEGGYADQSCGALTTIGEVEDYMFLVVPCNLGSVAIIANSPVCEGDQLTMEALSSNALEFVWKGVNDFSAATSTILMDNVTVEKSGVYTVTAKGGLDGCTVTSEVNVVVNAKPVSSPIYGPVSVAANSSSVLYTVNGKEGSQYVWTASGATLSQPSDGPNATFNFSNENSVIQVQEVNVHQCYGETSTIQVTVLITSIEESLDTGLHCKIVPNPVSDEWRLEGNTNSIEQLQLINQLGEVVFQIIPQENYSMPGVPAGLYVLKITRTDGTSQYLSFIRK